MKRFFAVIILLVAVTSYTSAQPTDSDPTQHPAEAFFLSGIDAFNAHDLDGLMVHFFTDFEMHTPQGWCRGLKQVRERFAQVFYQNPSVKMEIEDLTVREFSPKAVAVDFNWKVYPTGSGPAYHGVTTGVYVKRNGKWGEVLEHESVVKVDQELIQSRE